MITRPNAKPTGFVCGTRAVFQVGPSDYRVVCASCNEEPDFKLRYTHKQHANSAAVRDSDNHCKKCGAS